MGLTVISKHAKSRRLVAILALSCASAVAAQAAEVALKGGAVALNLRTPSPQDLSSAASVGLDLPLGSMKAQATTSVGREGDNPEFWQKNAAQVDARVSGPLGSSLTLTGQDAFGFTYRPPASVGASDTASHMVRAENRTANASFAVPVGSAQLTVGGEGSLATTQDTEKGLSAGDRAIVTTQDRSLFGKGEWQPIPAVRIEGGAAVRTSDISWREQRDHTNTFRSLDPHVSASLSPLQDTTVTARLEHKVSPYDAAAFAGYAAANPSTGGPSFEPDHAWQLQMQVQQKVGVANLTATYTAARSGTITEFAEQNGSQIPAAARLEKRDNVAIQLSLPLSPLGLANTELSSQAEWNDSEVVDPLTQKLRGASGEVPSKFSLRMAHKLPNKKLSFGLTGEFSGARTSYQVGEISSTDSGGSVGAFLSFKPGPYQVDLSVNGLYGGDGTNTFYSGSRATSQISRTVMQDNGSALFNLSLHKQL